MAPLIEWPVKHPASKANPIPLYCVTWDVKGGRRGGNRWFDRRRAEAVFVRKLAEGRRPESFVRHVAGAL